MLRPHHLQLLHLLPQVVAELGRELPVLGEETRHLELVAVLDPVHLLLVLGVHDCHLLLEVLHQVLDPALCLLGDLLAVVNLDLLLLDKYLRFLLLSLIIKLVQFCVLPSPLVLSKFSHTFASKSQFLSLYPLWLHLFDKIYSLNF